MKQILSISLFELQYWKRKPSVYVNFFIIFLLSLLIFSIEDVQVGGSTEVIYKNSPQTLTYLYLVIVLFSPLILNEFISFSIARDYEYKFYELIYSYPVSRFNLYLGRFLGSSMIVLMIFLSVMLADFVAHFVPWLDDKTILLPFSINSHFWCLIYIVIPNIITIGCILFFFTSLLKSVKYSILISIGLVALYYVFLQISDEIINHNLISLSDPFAFIPISDELAKQTAYEMNHYFVTLTSRFYINRIIWLTIGIGLFLISIYRQKIRIWNTSKSNSNEKSIQNDFSISSSFSLANTFQKISGWKYVLYVILNEAILGIKYIYRSRLLIVILGIFFLMYFLRFMGMIQSDEAPAYATTFNTLKFVLFFNLILKIFFIYLASELFWKDKTYFFDEIKFSLPIKPHIILLGKFLSVVLFYLCVGIFFLLFGIIYQVLNGHASIEWDLYFIKIFFIEFSNIIFISILLFFLNVFTGQKFLSMAITVILLIFQPILKDALHIKTNMIGILPSFPEMIYSDFYGYGPYFKIYFAFWLYWLLLYLLLFEITLIIFNGYQNLKFKQNIKLIFQKIKFNKVFIVSFLITFSYALFIFYQTQIKNFYLSYDEDLNWRYYYEKQYKKYKDLPQPKIVYADYEINLYGKERKYNVKGKLYLKNKESKLISELYINNPFKYPFKILNNNLKLTFKDSSQLMNFEIYQLNSPLLPGDSLLLEYTYSENHSGIENELSNVRLLPNGTFLDNEFFTPKFGYDESLEINENSKRKKYGLPLKQEELPPLERNCNKNCYQNYLGLLSDWANVHCVVSTYEDQIAVAPGKLVKQWKANARNYFEYNLKQPSLFFFSIVSGKFEIKKEKLKNIDLEVYYHPAHYWNIDQIMKALKSSMEYYTSRFGPYYHSEARIIEFPGFSSFAQAFPGTMPYSENIGFTANYSENEEDINRVFHVVSHEMAHQWWAHQLIGAKMQGAALLSESLAEFTASLVLEEIFGKEMLWKFLRNSNRMYIKGRVNETKIESPLISVDNQSYVYYNKAAVVLNSIKQMLGFENILKVLQNLINSYAYKGPPYPTSYILTDELYKISADSMKSLVKEHFEKIIIWDLKVKNKSLNKINDSLWKAEIEIELYKQSYETNPKMSENIRDTKLGYSVNLPISGYLNFSIFVKDDGKSTYGKVLETKNIKLNGNKVKIEFICNKKPDKIVVDPSFIFIWKDLEKKEIKFD